MCMRVFFLNMLSFQCEESHGYLRDIQFAECGVGNMSVADVLLLDNASVIEFHIKNNIAGNRTLGKAL